MLRKSRGKLMSDEPAYARPMEFREELRGLLRLSEKTREPCRGYIRKLVALTEQMEYDSNQVGKPRSGDHTSGTS